MRKITEVQLPGVGVRYEFTSARGERIAVVAHRGGRQDLSLYDRHDADTCRTILELDSDDAATLASILGVPQVAASASAMQRVEGLALDWVTVTQGSTAAGSTIAEGGYRSRTGTSIVAILRDQQTIPAPGPDLVIEAGDVAVAVGTPEGLAQLRSLLAS
ncbi:MAG TPA: cation:proton antiporter regulatory subunit [Acidimicrobiales bacterium]|jgi:TrkA domain protein|nr:cation:proton antiporter regulatory subunit [Acidimicrobiales bacterium]